MAPLKNELPEKGESLRVVVLQGFHGGDEGDRTPDLLNAIQARSQLRHAPMLCIFGASIFSLVCHSFGGDCQSSGGFLGGCVTDQLVLPAELQAHIKYIRFLRGIVAV